MGRLSGLPIGALGTPSQAELEVPYMVPVRQEERDSKREERGQRLLGRNHL